MSVEQALIVIICAIAVDHKVFVGSASWVSLSLYISAHMPLIMTLLFAMNVQPMSCIVHMIVAAGAGQLYASTCLCVYCPDTHIITTL